MQSSFFIFLYRTYISSTEWHNTGQCPFYPTDKKWIKSLHPLRKFKTTTDLQIVRLSNYDSK